MTLSLWFKSKASLVEAADLAHKELTRALRNEQTLREHLANLVADANIWRELAGGVCSDPRKHIQLAQQVHQLEVENATLKGIDPHKASKGAA